MEIDITHLVTKEDCSQFSDSIANSGRQDIGRITWANACAHAASAPLVTTEQQGALRAYIREFGAWDREEIAAMTDDETNALLLQFIAGDIREMESYSSREQYEDACEQGRCSGHISESSDGRFYYYVGM